MHGSQNAVFALSTSRGETGFAAARFAPNILRDGVDGTAP
jgi:hypothetical protein